jgi:dTDP-L-rhamnose 4-epimerase
MKKILITGGAGFIGSRLSNNLISKGYQIVVLDNLSKQIHGENPDESELYLSIKDKVHFITGDVRNLEDWKQAIQDCDAVVHLAAETGTGQSMYEVNKYVDVNINATSLFLDYLVNQKHTIKKVIVASSRAVYGEGSYMDAMGNTIYPDARLEMDMDKGVFEPQKDGKSLQVIATKESAPFKPQSVYGITKQVQEQLVLNVCGSINIPAVALRFQNVYGPGQSLKNPYTGILSIFSTLIHNQNPINIFEDGLESRDFVYIDDVVNSIVVSLESEKANGKSYNVGTGVATNVIEVAEALQDLYGKKVPTQVTGNYRKGDIRHNFADMSLIKHDLNYEAKIDFKTGLKNFTDWVSSQTIEASQYEKSIEEMKSKGIMK